MLTTLKIAVFAPIPSVNAASATHVNPGDAKQQARGEPEVLPEDGHGAIHS